ncbi:trace amine-associated receptor 13c-like [Asterias rubens]|uniref:trace amine-associated receptor 13c-like n=1 Tax=Asterias rubens TaxID=7604 RepID=UPI001454F8D4|nr:trace amine-associated receptor 13c-like [Asterias rubens]
MEDILSTALADSLTCPKIYDHADLQLPRTILSSLVSLLVISGNSLCLVCLRKSQAFGGTTRVFMTSLTIADLMMGVFICVPSSTYATISGWVLGYPTCLVTAHLNFYLVTMSVLSLLLVSLNRFISVVRPFWYQTITPSQATVTVVVSWVMALVFSLVVLFTGGINVCFDAMLNICIPLSAQKELGISISTVTSFVVVIVVSYLLTIGIYVRLYLIARRHLRQMNNREANDNPAGHVQLPLNKATITFAIVTVAFGVAYIPMILIAVDYFINGTGCQLLICGLAPLCTLSNSWWNVAIYSIRNAEFRETMKHVLQSAFIRRPRPQRVIPVVSS